MSEHLRSSTCVTTVSTYAYQSLDLRRYRPPSALLKILARTTEVRVRGRPLYAPGEMIQFGLTFHIKAHLGGLLTLGGPADGPRAG